MRWPGTQPRGAAGLRVPLRERTGGRAGALLRQLLQLAPDSGVPRPHHPIVRRLDGRSAHALAARAVLSRTRLLQGARHPAGHTLAPGPALLLCRRDADREPLRIARHGAGGGRGAVREGLPSVGQTLLPARVPRRRRLQHQRCGTGAGPGHRRPPAGLRHPRLGPRARRRDRLRLPDPARHDSGQGAGPAACPFHPLAGRRRHLLPAPGRDLAALPEIGLEEGERMREDWFPVVWRKDGGLDGFLPA